MVTVNINKISKLDNQVNESYKRLRTNVQLLQVIVQMRESPQ